MIGLFSNRIGRKNYILGLLFLTVLFFVLFFASIIVLANIGLTDLIIPFGNFLLIPYGLFVYGLHIRRLHDRGHSGWWILFFYIDIWLNIFIKGQDFSNKYGEIPDIKTKFFNDLFNRR